MINLERGRAPYIFYIYAFKHTILRELLQNDNAYTSGKRLKDIGTKNVFVFKMRNFLNCKWRTYHVFFLKNKSFEFLMKVLD